MPNLKENSALFRGAAAVDPSADTSGRLAADRAVHVVWAVSGKFGLPKAAAESAVEIFNRAGRGSLQRGRPAEVTASALLYAACRALGYPHSLREIVEAVGVDFRAAARCYRRLAELSDLRVPPGVPSIFVPKIAVALRLSAAAAAEAQRIAVDWSGLGAGHEPTTIASAAAYLAGARGGENRSQSEVAEAAGVSKSSLQAFLSKAVKRSEKDKERG